MKYLRRLVCLANSRKKSGRCVAGKEVLAHGYGQWIRPVSKRPSAEISSNERCYKNGQDPCLLDIIDVPMIAATPLFHQTENHTIDAEYYWAKTGQFPWSELKRLVDTPAVLWPTGDSSYYGLNDRVKSDTAANHSNSLVLIQVQDLSIFVQTEGAEFGNPRRRVRAYFKYLEINYLLIVTDPLAERAFLARNDGRYHLIDTYLSVSLGETHSDEYCYKLVAGIITKETL